MNQHRRIVTLKSGGTIDITLVYDPFALSQAERAFLIALLDLIRAYEVDTGAAL